MSTMNNATGRDNAAEATTGAPPAAVIALVWLWVLVPFAYGVYELVLKAKNLFS